MGGNNSNREGNTVMIREPANDILTQTSNNASVCQVWTRMLRFRTPNILTLYSIVLEPYRTEMALEESFIAADLLFLSLPIANGICY